MQLRRARPPPDQVLRSTAMNNDPIRLGTVTACKELEEAIADFYHPSSEPAACTPKAAAQTNSSQSTSAKSSDVSDALEVMIAIEPDPVHTHLSLSSTATSIRSKTPCRAQAGSTSPTGCRHPSSSAPAGARFVDQEQQRLFNEGREQYPGVILFRSDQPRQALTPGVESKGQPEVKSATLTDAAAIGSRPPLAVFVVGNSPTGGVDRTQFEEALVRVKGPRSPSRDAPHSRPQLHGLRPILA